VLVVPDHKLGTNDCRGWIRRSLFQRLKQKHDDDILTAQVARLRNERFGKLRDEDLDEQDKVFLSTLRNRRLPGAAAGAIVSTSSAWPFPILRRKGHSKSWRMMLPTRWKRILSCLESAVKPGLKIPAVMYSIFGPGRRFAGNVAVGIREVSRQLEFESSYTLIEHAPEDSIQLEILPQAMKQVAKLSEAVGEGRYEDLLEIMGRHPDKTSGALELDPNEEFRIVEGLLLADASGEIVRHPYVNNQLNKLLARWGVQDSDGRWLLSAGVRADGRRLSLPEGWQSVLRLRLDTGAQRHRYPWPRNTACVFAIPYAWSTTFSRSRICGTNSSWRG